MVKHKTAFCKVNNPANIYIYIYIYIVYSFEAAAAAAAAKSLQSCPTLCDPIDGSPPGSPVPGILQARTLEWVAIFFSTFEAEVCLNPV